MPGRKQAEPQEVHVDFMVESCDGVTHGILKVQLKCPFCGCALLYPNGTRPRKKTRVLAYRCSNQACITKSGIQGRQFSPHTSRTIQAYIQREVEVMIEQLYMRGAKGNSVADEYGVSPSFVSFLRAAVDAAIKNGITRDQLVQNLTGDIAVSIDETFFKINNVPIYVIIVRGYNSDKVIGVNVSTSRKTGDIKKAFDEAQRNTSKEIGTITCDAWGATRKMAHELYYPLTLIIHPHKKPYKKVIVERIEYRDGYRVITQTGIKTNMFKRRGKREFWYTVRKEALFMPLKQPRGRPKGTKNGTGKKARKVTTTASRSPRGLFKVFTSGKRGYVRVFPGKKRLLFVTGVDADVKKGLTDTFVLFRGKHVQNNFSETINNILRTVTCLNGSRSIEALTRRIRALLIMRNDHVKIDMRQLKRKHRVNIYFNRRFGEDFQNDLSLVNVITTCSR
jgi:hypothetical protein